MPVKHVFASAKSDGADATLVRPSNWNDYHVNPYGAGATFTIATGNGALQVKQLVLTGTQRMTLEGDARLYIL